MRQAERALFDLRRGLPMLLSDHGSNTLVLTVEALNDEALQDAQQLGGNIPPLVRSRHRMAAPGHIIADDAVALTPTGPTDNNPNKLDALRHAGIRVVARQAIYGDITTQNQRCLETKASRQGHCLTELLGSVDI